MLKKPRLLVVDEGTSACDATSDAVLQRTLREAFPGCTVFTIAHRMATILDSSTIVVISFGCAVEVGTPGRLLANPMSSFAAMVADSDKSHTHFVIEPCMARLLLQWIWRRRRVSGAGSAALVGPPIGTVQDPPTGDDACVS